MLVRHSYGDAKTDIDCMSLLLKGEVEVADVNLGVIGVGLDDITRGILSER